MKFSFVIGNGISRGKQNLTKLVNHGTVYTCNYGCVDIPCHHCITTKRELLFDILSQNKIDFTVWSRAKWATALDHSAPIYPLPEQLFDIENSHDLERNISAGTFALDRAARDNPDIIVMLGFDLYNKGTHNSLYASRKHYSHDPVNPTSWIHQIEKVFKKYPNVTFVSIQPSTWKAPKEWKACANFSTDIYKNLWAMLE